MQWWLTKESGLVPVLCERSQAERMWHSGAGMRVAAGAGSVLALKVVGGDGVFEVMVGPLCVSGLQWLKEEILPEVLADLGRGAWSAVVDTFVAVCRAPEPCGGWTPATQLLWCEVGWRRLHVPEVGAGVLPSWWRGVSDALGDCGGMYGPWLRCPCGMAHLAGP